mmetsp:Transcript_7854/g.28921  ORF Transcript_7854/g.28921 Transcript_7854/m.28921 type:complete len:249 (-) Transcript_7854:13-759(-)
MTRDTTYFGLGDNLDVCASYSPSSVVVYAATYPDNTKNAPTTTFTCEKLAKVNAFFVAHAIKCPTPMYAMRKNLIESNAGNRGFDALALDAATCVAFDLTLTRVIVARSRRTDAPSDSEALACPRRRNASSWSRPPRAPRAPHPFAHSTRDTEHRIAVDRTARAAARPPRTGDDSARGTRTVGVEATPDGIVIVAVASPTRSRHASTRPRRARIRRRKLCVVNRARAWAMNDVARACDARARVRSLRP